MTVPLWCLIVVAALPLVLAISTIYFRIRQFGSWDNNDPRKQYEQLSGAGWRVWAAQQNAWEALALFTAVVMISYIAGSDPDKSGIAAIVYACTRLIHPVLYIANLSTLRTISFTVGLSACIYMIVLAAET